VDNIYAYYLQGILCTAVKSASDEALIAAFQQRQLAALEEFYDRHHGVAMAIAYRVLEDREVAEDVLQEAFLAAWRQADTFRPERGSARSWFLSIVRHRAIDVTRGRAYARERISLDALKLEPRYPDAWQQVGLNLERERVKEAVETLPPEQSEAVMLAYFGGFTHPEIAQRTGVPLGTVKGRLRLALQKLRNLLAEFGTEVFHQ
jgi:RNA polymerase sigma-70 factor (ECF subfamily)